LEPDDCSNFCNEQRELLGVAEETTCCLQARYWYSWYDLWAADCALIRSKELDDLEDDWDEENGLYTTFSAFITEPDVKYAPSNSTNNYEIPLEFVNENTPSDWRNNKKWYDGKFCDVEDAWTDYLMYDDSSRVNNREKCYDFCSDNRVDTEANCCGMIFTTNLETGRSNVECGLYFSDYRKLGELPLEINATHFHYTTAIIMGDGLREKLEDAVDIILDAQTDWGNTATKACLTAATAALLVLGTIA
jgi:hypothetical protein